VPPLVVENDKVGWCRLSPLPAARKPHCEVLANPSFLQRSRASFQRPPSFPSGLKARSTWRFKARMMPMRANIVGPPDRCPSYHLQYDERRENCPVADCKLLIDVMEVLFDSAVGNIQPAPNFLVRQPSGHQTHDL
jgi:hypothetical protein